MVIAWLRSKPKPLILLQRETQPLPREQEHAGAPAWDILLPTAVLLTFSFWSAPLPLSVLSLDRFKGRASSRSAEDGGCCHCDSLTPSSSAGLEDSWVSMVGGRIWGSCEKYLWNFMNETGRLTASCHVGDVSHAGRRAT